MPRTKSTAIVLALLLGSWALAASPKAKVTGEVVDSACYIKSGARGESHRACAQRCADAGIPLALVEDGTGNVVWLASVDDMETPNARLKEHAGRKVTITGTWVERGGAKLLLVETVEPEGKK